MKAIALISGGLDSILAARLVQEQGIEVIGLYFSIPSCVRSEKVTRRPLPEYLSSLGLQLKQLSISDEFLDIINNPRHGYGSDLKPCIDCKILMLRKARELMPALDVGFVVTGEVLGQRPMSQHRQALELIERESGLEGLVLRPLSAKLLKETIPERQGWVKRQDLLAFCGRTRRPQMDLAKVLNIENYPNPAGGCLLTDPQFSKRIRDLLEHEGLSIPNIELLKIGRHFRIADDTRLVVGRDEGENEKLANLAQDSDYLFMPSEVAGPTALGRGIFNQDLSRLACAITCRYCDLDRKRETEIVYSKKSDVQSKTFLTSALKDEQIADLRI